MSFKMTTPRSEMTNGRRETHACDSLVNSTKPQKQTSRSCIPLKTLLGQLYHGLLQFTLEPHNAHPKIEENLHSFSEGKIVKKENRSLLLDDDCLVCVIQFLSVNCLSPFACVCHRWNRLITSQLQLVSRFIEAWNRAAVSAYYYEFLHWTKAGQSKPVTRFVQFLPVERMHHLASIESYRGYMFPDNVMDWHPLVSTFKLPDEDCSFQAMVRLRQITDVLHLSPFCYLSPQKQRLIQRLVTTYRSCYRLRFVTNMGCPIQIYQYQLSVVPLTLEQIWLPTDVFTFSIARFHTDPGDDDGSSSSNTP